MESKLAEGRASVGVEGRRVEPGWGGVRGSTRAAPATRDSHAALPPIASTPPAPQARQHLVERCALSQSTAQSGWDNRTHQVKRKHTSWGSECTERRGGTSSDSRLSLLSHLSTRWRVFAQGRLNRNWQDHCNLAWHAAEQLYVAVQGLESSYLRVFDRW